MMYNEETESRWNYWERRNEFMDIFRPNRYSTDNFKLGTLTKKLPNGTSRAIDVTMEMGPKFIIREPGSWRETTLADTIRFLAADPTFYDPVQVCLSWVLTAADHWVLPFYFSSGGDLQFQSSVIGNDITVTYSGTWLAFPVIIIVGPLNGIQIDNFSTGETIVINYNVSAGETLTIDLRYGQKTVISSLGTNLVGTISDDSDLATFHIAPSGEVSGGVNVLRVSGGGAVIGTTLVQIAYYTRYIGI